jgi:hypothetical protein
MLQSIEDWIEGSTLDAKRLEQVIPVSFLSGVREKGFKHPQRGCSHAHGDKSNSKYIELSRTVCELVVEPHTALIRDGPVRFIPEIALELNETERTREERIEWN